MDRLTSAVIRALESAPCSLRALARTAGVSHVQLLHITQGKRRATPAVAAKVAEALDTWSTRCAEGARGIRQAKPRGNR
jgi:transcriptional regulator with XRE-family HTH domain